MPALLWKLNYRNIVLREEPGTETVGVLQRSGEYRHARWLGFLAREQAKLIQGCSPVKLRVDRVNNGDEINGAWVNVPPDRHVQGATLPHANGVFGVLDGDKPRII